MLDHGRAAGVIAQDLGLDAGSVYRRAQTYHLKGLAGYLAAEQPGYWGLLSSAQLAGLCRALGKKLYIDYRAITDWLHTSYGVRYTVSGLTDLLHRLGYSYKLITAVPCLADAAKQTTFFTDKLAPLLAPLLVQAEAGEAVVYFANAAHPEGPVYVICNNTRYYQNKVLNA